MNFFIETQCRLVLENDMSCGGKERREELVGGLGGRASAVEQSTADHRRQDRQLVTSSRPRLLA